MFSFRIDDSWLNFGLVKQNFFHQNIPQGPLYLFWIYMKEAQSYALMIYYLVDYESMTTYSIKNNYSCF